MTAFVATCAVIERGHPCGIPTQDYLCKSHRDELVAYLREVAGELNARGEWDPTLLDELDSATTRQVKMGGQSIGVIVHGAETPVPFNEKTSHLKYSLCNAVVTWTLVFAEENPHLTFDVSTIEQAAAWMIGFPNLLAGHEAAVEMHSEFRDLLRQCHAAIDRPADRLCLGPCGGAFNGVPCDQVLYVRSDRHEVVCSVCTTEHRVEDRRRELKGAVGGELRTATEMSRAIPAWFGVKVTPAQIRKWASRTVPTGRVNDEGESVTVPMLPKVGERKIGETRSVPTYRVSDVVDILMRMQQERQAS